MIYREALLHLGDTYNITTEEIEHARIAKLKEKGGFSLNLILGRQVEQ